METTPIKRNKHIIPLSKDHHFTLLFCWKIRNGLKLGIEPARIKKYVQYFWDYHMQPHFEQEETILFISVKDDAVGRALHEHAQIVQQINDLDADGINEQQKLSTLANMVDEHVRYEERELFPHLEKLLTDENLKSIGRQIIKHHDQTLADDFGDKFWVKKNNGL